MTTEATYQLSIDLAVLDDLGMNLYSNTPAVLSEAVANAYDADAELIKISIDISNDCIVIEDDGAGMSRQEINNKYLSVGYKRRTDKDLPERTPKHNRLPMGRKGIGKLSLFSLADTIRVESTKGGNANGCILSATKIREHILENSSSNYEPEAILPKEIDISQGTRITLTNLNKERVSTDWLRIRLARRFSVIGTKYFRVEIDGEEVKAEHRFGSIPLLFSLTDEDSEDLFGKGCDTEIFPDPESPPWDPKWGAPKGWFGVVKARGDLSKSGENLNKLPVLARGRLCVENILDYLDDGRLITKYMSGQITADFLDDSDHDDIVTSNRQQVRENDKRFLALKSYLASLVTKLDNERNKRIDKDSQKEIREQYPQIASWLDELKPATQKVAEKMLTKIHRMKELEDKPEQREEFLRTGVIAFERLRIYDQHKELADAIEEPGKLLMLLEDLDGFEASLYLDIVKNRISTIETLESLVDANALEKDIQDWLFKHLWLFDTGWERASGSEVMEQHVAKEFDLIKKKEKLEIQNGRIDIKYRKAVGTHVIIELKRPKRKLNFGDTVNQLDKYKEGLLKCLEEKNIHNKHIECVIISGDLDFVSKERERLQNVSIKVFHYKELLENANRAYGEFYEKRAKVDSLAKLFETKNPKITIG